MYLVLLYSWQQLLQLQSLEYYYRLLEIYRFVLEVNHHSNAAQILALEWNVTVFEACRKDGPCRWPILPASKTVTHRKNILREFTMSG